MPELMYVTSTALLASRFLEFKNMQTVYWGQVNIESTVPLQIFVFLIYLQCFVTSATLVLIL